MRAPVDIIFPPLETGHVPYWRLILRGCSQLCFQTNELTGVFFLAAVFVASPIAAAYMFVAASLAPGARMLLGDRGAVLETGLPGLNPCLIALSLPTFYQTGWSDFTMWAVIVGAVLCTVLLTRFFLTLLAFPILVLPFLITFWGLSIMAPSFNGLQPLVFSVAEPATFNPLRAVLSSLGESMFSPDIWSGLLFATGVFLSNWRHGLLALTGAAIGTAVAHYDRSVTDAAGINLGLYGFNGVLAAVSVFVFCGSKLRLSILAAFLATTIVPAVSAFGVNSLSAPFVLVTWLMLVLGWIENNWFNPRQKTNSVPAGTSGRPTQSDDRQQNSGD